MKKILFIVNVDWFFISHRLPIALKAIKEGYDVHLACNFTNRKSELIELGLHLHDIDLSRSGNGLLNELKTLITIRSIIKLVKPDVIHAITIKPVIYSGLILHSISKKPAFIAAISGLGYVFSARTFKAKLTKVFISLLYRVAFCHQKKIVIFQNSSDLKILTSIANINSKQKMLIPGSGVDLDKFIYKPEPDLETLKVVMASRLLKEKGVYEFVEAARLVRKEISNVEFVLVGSPDAENPHSVLQGEIDDWHSSKLITALGYCDDIPKILSGCHIVTLPSYYGEGIPKVLIEAAACGRATVTTDNPGCKDAIVPNITGLLVAVRDSEALAEQIIYLLNNKIMRENMGIAARALAVREYDIKSVVAKHIDIYSAILLKNKRVISSK